MSPLHIILIAVSLVFLAAGLLAKAYRHLPLPPALPSSEMRTKRYPWVVYADWSKRAGPLITVPAMGRPIVVINTAKAATDLLERRSTFACRPRWPMAELLGRQDNVGFTYYGEKLRKMRKLLHAALSVNAITATWDKLLEGQSLSLCKSLSECPDAFYEIVENNLQDLIVRFAYGHAPDAEYIRVAKTVMHQTGEALAPGRWAVNFLPVLIYVPSWVPGASFKVWAKQARDTFLQMTRSPFYRIKRETQESGRSDHSFVKDSLERLPIKHSQEDEDVIMFVAGSLFSAGTETVTGTILTFIALMLHHPEVQERVYKEIDKVVGHDRLPSLQDRANLPYLHAVLQETHRFNPAVPLVTHSNTADETYGGSYIPKKTWIMANVWAMLHDESIYPRPSQFEPTRFYATEGMEAKLQPDPTNIVYGFGRRRCPGAHFANIFLSLVAARVLALFEILPKEEGPLPPIEFGLGLVAAPVPFKCRFRPRSGARELLAQCEN